MEILVLTAWCIQNETEVTPGVIDKQTLHAVRWHWIDGWLKLIQSVRLHNNESRDTASRFKVCPGDYFATESRPMEDMFGNKSTLGHYSETKSPGLGW